MLIKTKAFQKYVFRNSKAWNLQTRWILGKPEAIEFWHFKFQGSAQLFSYFCTVFIPRTNQLLVTCSCFICLEHRVWGGGSFDTFQQRNYDRIKSIKATIYGTDSSILYEVIFSNKLNYNYGILKSITNCL